jgi:hypothetical protein
MLMKNRSAALISVFIYLAAVTAPAQSGSSAQSPQKVPILVELFTSEDCSTCPPADDLLTRLKEKQPIQGVELIALGFHVDYWDRLGWKDRFSSNTYTRRQGDYAKRFHDEVYTPQMVIDGEHLVQDGPAIPQLVATAAKTPKPIEIVLEQNGSSAEVQLKGNASTGETFLAVVEDGVETSVKGGENHGKTLHHAAVVRDWHPLGVVPPNSAKKSVPLTIPSDADRSRLQLVAFVQDPATGHILGLQAAPIH